jgi:hypothetical protein
VNENEDQERVNMRKQSCTARVIGMECHRHDLALGHDTAVYNMAKRRLNVKVITGYCDCESDYKLQCEGTNLLPVTFLKICNCPFFPTS